ncbi:probable helicase senataxin isoform X2 [Acropora muricata]|uniref:probable helicase senataxin isoform X2 n=1 Tax=Acropora muricata TaxID=159855 RepID=UPI0034E50E36
MDVVVKQEPMSCWPNLELNRACEWCSSPDFMRGVIKDYVHKPLDEWQELLLDLCYCYDCVQEYHRLADEAKQNNPRSALFQEFLTLDIERLTHTIGGALESSAEDVLTKLQVPLMEVLGFPYLLHHKQLADRFVDGIIAVLKFSYPLKLEEKLPGAYLLLIHPNEKVRAWATRNARSLGLISRDDYDILVEVIEWMLGVVTFDISSNLIALDDIAIHNFLPPHLFVTPSFSEYWTGLVVLVMQMDFATVRSCLMSSDENGHRDFLVTIMSNLQDQNGRRGTFLVCFAVLYSLY